jgi:hypothetical protein
MTITTEYNLGDSVFWLHHNKIYEGNVTKIEIDYVVDKNEFQKEVINGKTYYWIDCIEFWRLEKAHAHLPESDLFPTKQALLESL